MALPLHLLLGLFGVNRKQKAGLAAIFSLGFFIIAVALVRVFQTRATKEHHVDPIWLALWSQIEASVGKLHSPSPSPPFLSTKKQFTIFHSCRGILPPLLRLPPQQARPLRIRLQTPQPFLLRPLDLRHPLPQVSSRGHASWHHPSRNLFGNRFPRPERFVRSRCRRGSRRGTEYGHLEK